MLVLAAFWCARSLLRPQPLRAPVPLAIFGVYVGIAWLTSYSAYTYEMADRGFQNLSACLLVFAMASNALRTRRAIAIVLGATVIGLFLNSLWTIFHYNVMLRGMRRVLQENPSVLEMYFGVRVPTPELKHRIESNRAFGTFLFPNALGAYVILGIPVLAAALPSARRALALARNSARPKQTDQGRWVVMGITLLVGVVVLVMLSFANELIGLSLPKQKALIEGAYRPYLFFIPVAGVFGAAAGWITARKGARALGYGFMGMAVPVALVACLVSLWLSYSRGAMLGLVLASAATLLLLNASKLPWAARYTRAAAALVLLGATLWSITGSHADDVDGYRIAEPQPSSMEYLQRKHLEVAQEMQTLNIEGMDRRLDSLADPNSLRLRTTYWRVGLRMFYDNFWKGVGIGNFRTGYPKYQYLGAGSAETAHNDYLQAFCETGIFGGIAFLAFWVYFAVWGGRRLLFEQDPETRRWLAATYCATGAFALHCILDFDLQNPCLALLVYAMAGLFFAIAGLNPAAASTEASASNPVWKYVAAGALSVLTLYTTAAVTRIYFYDLGTTESGGLGRLYVIGDRKPMEAKLEAAQVVKQELTKLDMSAGNPPIVQVLGALRAIPDLAELQTLGTIRVPLPENPRMFQRLKPGQAVPMNGYVFFDLQALPAARAALRKAAERRIEVLHEWDKSYPHDAEMAAHIFSWYDLLFSITDNVQEKKRYAAEAERWSRTATERSPESFIWWSFYAKSLWMRGSLEPGEPGIDFYRTGLQYYRKAAALYPTGPSLAFQLGNALQRLGEELVRSGRADEGQPLIDESKAMYERSVVLDRYVSLVR